MRVATMLLSGNVPDPDGHVDMFVDQLGVPVRQLQPHTDLGEGGQELGHDRQDVQPSEQDGGGQDQLAPGGLVLPGRDPLGRVYLVKDAPG